MTDVAFYKDQLMFVLLYITIINVILVPVCFIPLGFHTWKKVLAGMVMGLFWFFTLPVFIAIRLQELPAIRKGSESD